jgi:hydroxymethylglutaryl-CoA lyase
MAFKIIECPRDAMQGIKKFIPTEHKINYLNQLLKVGFDTIDAGSFVSETAIPQLADTAAVLNGIDLSQTESKLLVIVANLQGAKKAVEFDVIRYLGFPFSISETFQKRNTNSSINEAVKRVDAIQNLANKTGKEMVIYLSMGFGNPYGDPFNADIVTKWTEYMVNQGIKIISLSDTIGVSTPELIRKLFKGLSQEFPQLEIGAHLHTRPESWKEKIQAAYESGCTRYDGAIRGYGGCPMASDSLTGNMPTENLLSFLIEHNESPGLNQTEFNQALALAGNIFV